MTTCFSHLAVAGAVQLAAGLEEILLPRHHAAPQLGLIHTVCCVCGVRCVYLCVVCVVWLCDSLFERQSARKGLSHAAYMLV